MCCAPPDPGDDDGGRLLGQCGAALEAGGEDVAVAVGVGDGRSSGSDVSGVLVGVAVGVDDKQVAFLCIIESTFT